MKILISKIFLFLCITLSLFLSLFSSADITSAHALFPPETMQFLEDNPNATEDELNAFMVKTYGPGILEEVYGPPLDSIDSINTSGGDNISPTLTPLEGDKSMQRVEDTAKIILSARDTEKPFFQNAKDFILLGIEHILAGLDHILFVISLVLLLPPRKKIIAMITTFTIAHSITLILAGSNIVTVSSKIVEPIIAFSIAYIAITTVFFKGVKFFQTIHNRLGVIFIFGLFHGLGFAGVFSDLYIPKNNYFSSILFFNVGIEIGQIMILLLVVPILLFVKRNKKIYDMSIKIFASIISLLAVFWVIQRIFF